MKTIRLEKKQNYPKTDSIKRGSLSRIGDFIIEESTVVSWRDIEQAVKKVFGNERLKETYLLLPDKKYRTVPKDALKELLAQDETDTRQYISTFADCNTFASVTHGNVDEMTWGQGLAVGDFWFYEKDDEGNVKYGHAINIGYNKKDGIFLWEPQSDTFRELKENWYPLKIEM